MLDQIYDRLEKSGLPDYAIKLIMVAALCVPIAIVMLLLFSFVGGSYTPQPREPAARTSSDTPAAKKIHPEVRKAEFLKVKEWMTVKEVQAIMGEGEIEKYPAPSGHSAEMHAYHYADGKVQVVVFADGKVAGTKEFAK